MRPNEKANGKRTEAPQSPQKRHPLKKRAKPEKPRKSRREARKRVNPENQKKTFKHLIPMVECFSASGFIVSYFSVLCGGIYSFSILVPLIFLEII